MPFFTSVASRSAEPRRVDEAFWTFLSRYDDPFADFTRRTVDAWYDDFPPAPRTELTARMRGKNALAYHGGCVELFGHRLLVRLGAAPVVVSRGADKTADFRTTAPVGTECVCEALATTDGVRQEWGRVSKVRAALRRLGTADFGLDVVRSGMIGMEPSIKTLRAKVNAFLRSQDALDYRDAVRAGRRTKQPTLNLHVGRAKLQIFPVVRRANSPPVESSLRLWFDGMLEELDTIRAIRVALGRKATRYGAPTTPYVILLNVLGDRGVLDEEVIDALYGDPAPSTAPLDLAGRTNGFWNSTKHTRVSAVVITRGVLPAPNHDGALAVYLNPWATQPLTGPLLQLSRVEAHGSHLVEMPGLTMAALFP